MKTKNYFIMLLLVCLSCSCSVNLAKRFRNHSNNMFRPAKDPQSFAQVDINSYNVSETASAPLSYNLLSLSAEGQAQFIKSLEAKFTDPKEFISQLNTNFNFSKESKNTVKIIPKSIKKQITFTINRLQYQDKGQRVIFNLMGDRIAYLEFQLKIPEGKNAVFNSWDKYATKYLDLNLGTATSSQQLSASVNLSAKSTSEATLSGSNASENLSSDKEVVVVNTGAAPNSTQNTSELINSLKQNGSNGTGAKIANELGGSAGLTYTDKFETSQTLNSRIIDLSGTLSKKELLLRQEGGKGIDLSGNITVSLEYALTNEWANPAQMVKFKDLYGKDGLPTLLKDLKYSFLTVIFPDITEDIVGELEYSFLYRQVKHGNRHLPEARQKVTFWYGTVVPDSNIMLKTKKALLIQASDIRPKAYVLEYENKPVVLQGYSPQFESVGEAAAFLHYLLDLMLLNKDMSMVKVDGVAITIVHLQHTIIKTKTL